MLYEKINLLKKQMMSFYQVISTFTWNELKHPTEYIDTFKTVVIS